jgi:hypothetical protein
LPELPDTRVCKRCGEEKPLKEGFHLDRHNNNYKYECRVCANKRWSAYGGASRKKNLLEKHLERARGKRVYTVVSDPSGTYPKGGRFEAKDFRHSLLMGAWPVGMVVYREYDKKCYTIGVRREGLDPV